MTEARSRSTTAEQLPPRFEWYRVSLLILVVVSTYTSVPLLSGDRVLIPSAPTVALAPLLFLAALPRFSMTDTVLLAKVSFLLLITIALSPGYRYLDEKLLGLAQCVMALGVALLIIRLMQLIRFERLERTLLLLWVAILAGSILEILDVTRQISDSFREWAYGAAYGLYGGEQRDMNMVGWLRPKLFSAEPSHVTKLFVAVINSWLLLRVSWTKTWIVTGATLAMLMIMGSPMLLISAIITIAIVALDRNVNPTSKVAILFATLLISVVFGIYYGASTFSQVTGRIATVELSPDEQGDLGSEERRIVHPYLVLIDTILRWPVFGVGISGKEVIFENPVPGILNPDAAIGNNVMAEMWTSLGIVGGVVFLFVLQRYARVTGVARIGLIGVIVASFSQLMGGMVTFRYWGFIALFLGAIAIADSRSKPPSVAGTHLHGRGFVAANPSVI